MNAATTYLDHNAAAPLRPEARAAMLAALDLTGNASSVHAPGRLQRRLVEEARRQVAALAGADPRGVIFTSGGTEANALALAATGAATVLASAVEHASVLKPVPAGRLATIPVDGDGVIDLDRLERALSEAKGPVLVALMLANNETGVLQPVATAARMARAGGAWIHCDAVAAAGKLDLDIAALGVDSLALSAHKLGGPQGVGALILADPDAPIEPLLKGGGQERGLRAGTENLAGIAGFGAAAEAARAEDGEIARLRSLRDRLEAGLAERVAGLALHGAGAARLANTSCFSLPGLKADTAVMALDLDGIAVSAGSACSSGKVGPSHVLAAMGRAQDRAIRISFGWTSRDEDMERALEALVALAARATARAA